MRIEFRDGVAHIDGTPGLLATADYPYYRDRPSVWRDRLRTLQDSTGIRIVSSYVPWRHHQPGPDSPADFTGSTHPDRDLMGYLETCADSDISVVLKPGPFIHAETNYGGLPDWICPLADPRVEAALDAEDNPVPWTGAERGEDGGVADWPLPSPMGAHFTARTTEWMRAVGKEVLQRYAGPEGPVIAVQIANEGLFTDGSRPLWAYDYSNPALAFFRDRLRERYGSLEEYNRTHATSYSSWSEIRPPRERRAAAGVQEQLALDDWGRFHSDRLTDAYHSWAEALAPEVPVLVNLNPPAGEPTALDAWLARVRPEHWNGITYGFTNWMGVVSTDRGAHARYVVAAKRAPGPNMEENWGFSELYDRAYAAGATSFHQTLLALAAGATGFNIYTGVATEGWSPDLDLKHTPPYPDCPPVDADGNATFKAETVRMLTEFFELHGTEYLTARSATGPSWGLYTPYAAVAAWATEHDDGHPACGRPLRDFHERMRATGQDYRIVDLETATPELLGRHPEIVLHGGDFMHAHVQRLLADHLAAGHRVQVTGSLPRLDENLLPCAILAESLERRRPAGPEQGGRPSSGSAPVRLATGHADVYWRATGTPGTGYLTVLVQSENEGPVTVRLSLDGAVRTVEIEAARGGAAVVRLVSGELDDFLVTGVNSSLDSALAPSVTVNGRRCAADHPGDLSRIRGAVSFRTP